MLNLFGVNVKKRLIEIDITQKELASALGISNTNLNDILSGRKKGWKHRDKIDEVLKNTKSRRVV